MILKFCFPTFSWALKAKKCPPVTSNDLGGQKFASMTHIKIKIVIIVILFNFLIGHFLRSLYLVT